MQSNQLQTTFVTGHWREQPDDATVPQQLPPITLDNETIERAAKALFEFVFSSCGRLDWTSCDESTKAGFKREATAVIMAVWPNRFAEQGRSGPPDTMPFSQAQSSARRLSDDGDDQTTKPKSEARLIVGASSIDISNLMISSSSR
jgi:hypothetical protein